MSNEEQTKSQAEAKLRDQIKAVVLITVEIGATIKALGSVPSGVLYAQVMGHLDLDQYQRIIDMLERQKLIEVKNHLITWIGRK
jgi:hypothetical protein